MKNIKLCFFLGLSLVMACFFAIMANAAVSSDRISGQNRYETSSKIAEYYNSNSVNDVILVSGEDFPDALSSSVLAHKLNAPILLVDSTIEGSANAFDYISKHLDKSGNIYIVGSATTARENFTSYLSQMGYKNIIEIGDKDRYYTNYMVAQQLNVSENTPVVISSGENYPDALGISSFAAYNNWPILLVPKDALPDKTSQFLLSDKPSKVYITGGTGVISTKVEDQIRELVPDAKVIRFAGKDRFDTNAQIIQTFTSEPRNIYLASGYGFADALSGSVLAARTGNPIVLIDPASNTGSDAISPLLYNYKDTLQDVISFGGTAVVPEVTATNLKAIISNSNKKDKGPMPEDEVERAVWYGFVSKEAMENPNAAVTFSQYCTMINSMTKLYGIYDAGWLQKVLSEAENSSTQMYRSDGMAAILCAATAMGVNEMNRSEGDVLLLNTKIGQPWDELNNNHFNILKLDLEKLTIPWESDFEDYMTAHAAIYFFTLGRVSVLNGKMLFDYDNKSNSMRLTEPMTTAEAARSVVRLYESTKKGSAVKKRDAAAEWDVKFLSSVENCKESILSSKTSIVKGDSYVMGKTFSGTTYYVSNGGDDANDGKTPETAWATIDKVNDTALAYGDAVFFKRGGTWYGSIKGQSGVTYSAYGEGNKPIISGSIGETAADPQKWSLAYTTNNGGKIWVYYKDLKESTGVFFDDGNKWGRRVTACWNGKNYVTDAGKPFEVSAALKEDLDYFPYVDISALSSVEYTGGAGCKGPFYLRCDEGNPGKVFKEIEFSIDTFGFENNGNDVTADNLHFLYDAICGISITSYSGFTGGVVQNCEVDRCGGVLLGYSLKEDGLYHHGVFSGGAIQVTGFNMTARNNYVHNVANKGIIIHASNADAPIGNIVISGNIIEDSPAALDACSYIKDNPKFSMGKILYEDNYVLRTGFTWGTEQIDMNLGDGEQSSINFNNGWYNSNSGIYIRNNVFYLAENALVYGSMGGADAPIFSGNTYVQNEKAHFADWEGTLISTIGDGNEAKTFIKDVLGDTKGVYVEVN